MSQSLNFQSLEDFLRREPDDLAEINLWYEKLSDYEIDGTESARDVDTLFNAVKYLMNFSFTAAEELKEVAERETVIMAEKEEVWEEQKQQMRDEITELRERITARADVGESSEAFRAQIDSLREENRQLQQLNRDRDVELADQRDRFESLVARADALTRERDALLDHKTQLEDSIRELNRRISAKSEEASNEWETRRLRLRNEQAVTLSKQVHAVVAQNDDLRTEVENVSEALEDATKLIEESSKKIEQLSAALKTSQKRAKELSEQNKGIKEELEEKTAIIQKYEEAAFDSSKILESKIQAQDEIITDLKDQLVHDRMKIEHLESQLIEDTTEQKEAELEKLKQELVAATQLARTMLGHEVGKSGPTQASDLPHRLIQTERKLLLANNKVEEMKKAQAELEDVIVQKELSHSEMAIELERLKELKLGSARDEITRLEEQLSFRDVQIEKLQRRCTLLHIELGQYAEGLRPFISQKPANTAEKSKEPSPSSSKPKEPIMEQPSLKPSKPSRPKEDETEKETKELDQNEPMDMVPIRSSSGSSWSEEKWERYAMLVAGLNYEIMSLIEENNQKDRQLLEMEHNLRLGARTVNEQKAKLKVAYEEIMKLKMDHPQPIENAESEENIAELRELRRLAESIRSSGSEMERRLEEATRKLIAERLQRVRLNRRCTFLQSRFERTTESAKRLQARFIDRKSSLSQINSRLQYELDNALCEIAKLQNTLLHSVPMDEYDNLSQKYKNLLQREVLGGEAASEFHPGDKIRFDLLDTTRTESVEELSNKNVYLKNLADILTTQTEHWRAEAESLRRENEELKRFVEDLENESDSKAVLSGVEQRLLEALRELEEVNREQQQKLMEEHANGEELARRRQQWNSERSRFVHVISMLQRALNQVTHNSLGTISVNMLEAFRAKMLEVRDEDLKLKSMSAETAKLQEKLDLQLRSSQAQQRASDTLRALDYNQLNIERQLQTAYLAASEQTALNTKLQNELKSIEKKTNLLEKEAQELQKQNMELLEAVASSTVRELQDGIREKTGNGKKIRNSEQEEKEDDEETDYEMDFASSDSGSSRSDAVPSPSRKFVGSKRTTFSSPQLTAIRAAAQTAINSYKEQLAQRDAAIESYRELLLNKINEPTKIIEKDAREEAHAEKERDLEMKLREAKVEIAMLKDDIEQLENSNSELYRERRKSVIPIVFNVEVQTEKEAEDEIRQPMSPIAEESSRSKAVSIVEEKVDLDEIDQIADQTLKFKNEIRTLKARVKKLTVQNKELTEACKRIKDDAIAELDIRRRNEVTEKEQDGALRNENIRLRQEIRQLRRVSTELQKQLDEANEAEKQLGRQRKNEEVSQWQQRKKTEESIGNLRRKLKEEKEKSAEIQERLVRREKKLEEMRADAETRQQDIERVNRRMRQLKSERDSALRESEQSKILKDHQIVLEDRIRKLQQELSRYMTKVQSLETTNSELNQKISTQKTVETRTEVVSVKDSAMEQLVNELRKELKATKALLTECEQKLSKSEKNYEKAASDYARLSKRLSSRESESGGAVAVLRDKLQAKDKEIIQLKSKINSLERRLSQ